MWLSTVSIKIKWNCHKAHAKRKMSTIYWIQRESKIFWKIDRRVFRGKYSPWKEYVINVCHFGHDFFFVDTLRGHQYHTRNRSIVCKRLRYKGYTGQRTRLRNSGFPLWMNEASKKAQESREIFRTPEKCPYNLQAGVENGTCARLFKRISDTSLHTSSVHTYVCVCVRIVHILFSEQI